MMLLEQQFSNSPIQNLKEVIIQITLILLFSNIKKLEVAQSNPKFTLIEGDIRDRETCMIAVEDCDNVLH